MLLAVDLGLSCGLAYYAADGRLRWYRSHHFAHLTHLKSGLRRILAECGELGWLVGEGDRIQWQHWERPAQRRGASTLYVSPEVWRERLLLSRDRRSGEQAKLKAQQLAREVIVWSGLSRPLPLRHDTAEAILIGYWGAERAGLLLPGAGPL